MEEVITRKKRIEFTVSDDENTKIAHLAAKAGMNVTAYCRARALQAPIRESQTEDLMTATRKALGLSVFRLLEMIKEMDEFDLHFSKPEIITSLREICDIAYKDYTGK